MTITGNFIGGKTVISSSNETMPVYDPATGKAVREVTVSTAQEVSEAIQVARDAFDSWSRTTPLRRARVLFNFKMLLEQHVEEAGGDHRQRARQSVVGCAGRADPRHGSGRIRLRDPAPD